MTQLPWTWLLIRSTGVTAFALLTAVVALGLLLRTRVLAASPPWLTGLHRHTAALALAFLAAHTGLLLVDPVVQFTPLQVLVPFTAPWNPAATAAGTLAFWLLVGPLLAIKLRTRAGKAGAKLFTKAHLAAYAAWPLAAGHFLFAGTDASKAWAVTVITVSVAVVAALLTVRGAVGRRTRRRA